MSAADVDLALAELESILAGLTRLKGAHERRREALLQDRLAPLPPCDVPPSEHRRLRRTGVPARIDADPELQAFVLARLGRLTFKSIAEEVAHYFPPERRVRHSAIHAWASRHTARRVRDAALPRWPEVFPALP